MNQTPLFRAKQVDMLSLEFSKKIANNKDIVFIFIFVSLPLTCCRRFCLGIMAAHRSVCGICVYVTPKNVTYYLGTKEAF